MDSGEIIEDTPSISRMFIILEPIALPIAMPCSPFFAAIIEVVSSGREVPRVTIVRPIIVSDMLSILARMMLFCTTSCPPSITATIPSNMKNNNFTSISSLLARAAGLKTCLYTGLDDVPSAIRAELTFLKTGAWRRERGGLDDPATNQRFIRTADGEVLNQLFWRN